MVRIAPIRLQYNPKTLWFDPKDIDIHKDDAVVVSTARGTEFGHAAEDIIDVPDEDIKKLKTELKPVLRLASEEDIEKAAEMERQSKEALPVFKEMASEASEDMHPVSVEYLLDGDKAVFYFESEERVDFRELVRKLAAHFRVRVDMRQIGVRDEARIVGGLGHCGQELCCKRLGGEFSPVSIRMAKEQDLSLNPQKISGVCGRLMCCLRYEFEAYKDFKSRAPKINAPITTPQGVAKVIDLDVPREVITIRTEDDKRIKIPLAEMKKAKGDDRPSIVSQEVFDTYSAPGIIDGTADSFVSTLQFKGDDKLASSCSKNCPRKRNTQVNTPDKAVTSESKARKPRRRRTHVDVQGETTTEVTFQKKAQKKQSSKNTNNKNQQNKKQTPQQKNKGKQKQQKQSPQDHKKAQSGPRPGQKSSGLRDRSKSGKPAKAKSVSAPSGTGQRRARKRSHKAGGTSDE